MATVHGGAFHGCAVSSAAPAATMHASRACAFAALLRLRGVFCLFLRNPSVLLLRGLCVTCFDVRAPRGQEERGEWHRQLPREWLTARNVAQETAREDGGWRGGVAQKNGAGRLPKKTEHRDGARR